MHLASHDFLFSTRQLVQLCNHHGYVERAIQEKKDHKKDKNASCSFLFLLDFV